MAKTTKQTRGIHSWIKFQKHQGVESLTIQGKESLADLSQDKNGDTNLILNADGDKINGVETNIPYINISTTWGGSNPNKTKVERLAQDLTQFPLSGGELVTVAKETDSLTIHDEKVKEFVTNAITEALKDVPITVAHHGTIISQFEKHTTNISLQDEDYFNNYVLITVINPNNAIAQFIFRREDFLDSDKPYKIINDFTISVKAELTEDKHLVFTFNTHDIVGLDNYQLMIEWFTNYKKVPIDSAYQVKLIRVRIENPTEHFEGYKNPLQYDSGGNLTYTPQTPTPAPAETPSNPPSLPNVTFPMASTSPQPELDGNKPEPQPIAEESH